MAARSPPGSLSGETAALLGSYFSLLHAFDFSNAALISSRLRVRRRFAVALHTLTLSEAMYFSLGAHETRSARMSFERRADALAAELEHCLMLPVCLSAPTQTASEKRNDVWDEQGGMCGMAAGACALGGVREGVHSLWRLLVSCGDVAIARTDHLVTVLPVQCAASAPAALGVPDRHADTPPDMQRYCFKHN